MKFWQMTYLLLFKFLTILRQPMSTLFFRLARFNSEGILSSLSGLEEMWDSFSLLHRKPQEMLQISRLVLY